MYKLIQLLILHLICNQVISQYAAVNGKSSMERIQTGCYLHALYLIYCIAVCHIYAGLFKCRSSVGEFVLDYQILRSLCINKGCNIGLLGSNNRSHILNSGLFQLLAYRISRSWGNLINHRPWEGNLCLICDVGYKIILYKALFAPLFCHGYDRALKLLAIMRAVIHGNYCQRILSCLIALIKQSTYNCHSRTGFVWSIVNICLNKREIRAICSL